MDGDRTLQSTISPAIATSQFDAGLSTLDARFSATIARMTAGSDTLGRSFEKTTRSLGGSTSAFDRLAGQFVTGYRDALAYANAIQQVQKYSDRTGDTLQLAAGVIEGISARFRVASSEAKNFALAMGGDARALADLGISADEAKAKLLALMAARDVTPPPTTSPVLSGVGDYVPPRVTDRQQQVLQALAEGRRSGEDTFGLATLGRDRFFGGTDRGNQQVIRALQAQGLVNANLGLTGTTAYQLAGVTPPLGAPGTGLGGEQLHTAFQTFIQQQRIAADPVEQRVRAQTAASFGPPILQPPTDQQHDARQTELDDAFRAFDRLRASFGLVTNAAVRYADQIDKITDAYSRGAITAREAQRLQSVAAVRTGQYPGAETVSGALGIQRQINDTVGIRPGFGSSGVAAPDLNRQLDVEAAFAPGGDYDAYDAARQDQAALERQQTALVEQQQRQTAQANAAAQQRLIAAPLPAAQVPAATTTAIGGLGAGAFGPASAAQFEQAATQVAAANDKLRASYDPVFAASQQYAQELKQVEDAARAAGASQQELDAALDGVTARFAAANQPLQGAYAAQQAAAKAATAATQAEARALDQTRRSLDEVYARSKAYEDELAKIDQLEAAGVAGKAGGISAPQAAAFRDTANVNFEKSVKDADEAAKHGKSSMEGFSFATAGATREFLVLGHEVVAGNYTRILPSLIVLAERMGGLRELITAAWAAFLTPIGLMVAGALAVAGAIAFLAFRGEQAQERMIALQNTLRGTRDDFVPRQQEVDAASRNLAATSPVGHQDARTSATQIVQNPAFQGSQKQLESLVLTAYKLQLVIGGTLPEATKILAEGFDDAGKAAQELSDKHFRGLDQRTVDYIKHIQEGPGGAQAAFEALRKIIDGTTAGVDKNLTHLQQSWQNFEKLLTSDSEGAFHAAGTRIADALGVVLDEINDLIKAWQEFQHLLDNGKGPVVPPGFSLYPWSSTPLSPTGASPTAAQGNNLTGFGHSGPGGGFSTFAKPEESITAAIKQLQINQDTHGQLTIAQQIGGVADPRTGQLTHGYSPAGENGAANTQAYIQQLAKAAGIDPNAPFNTHDQALVSKVITALAAHESGKPVDQAIIDKGVAAAFPSTGAGTSPSGLGTNQNADAKREEQLNADALSRQRTLNQANQDFLQKRLDAEIADVRKGTAAGQAAGQTPAEIAARPDVAGPAAAAIADTEKLAHLRGEMTQLITEQNKLAQSAKDAVAPFEAESGATRDLAAIENEFRIAARAANGGTIDQTALSAAQNAKLKELSLQFNDTIKQMDRQTNSQNQLVGATEIGGKTLDHAINLEKAMIEVRKSALPGTAEYARQVIALTEALDREAEAKRNLQAASGIHELEQESEQLQLQVKLLGASNEERNKELAILQARQHLGLSAGDVASPEQQRYIDYAGQVAQYKTQVEQAQQATQELEHVAEGALDKLASALTEPLKQGETAWSRLKDVATSTINDIYKEMLKLGVVNPLLNNLFGGHRPTLEDIGKPPQAPAAPPPLSNQPDKAVSSSPQAVFSGAVEKFAAAVEKFAGGAGSPAAVAHHTQELGAQNQAPAPAPEASPGELPVSGGALLPIPPIPPEGGAPALNLPPLPLVTPGATPAALEAPAITPVGSPPAAGPIPWLLRQIGIDTSGGAKSSDATLPIDPATGAVKTVSGGYVDVGGETAKQAGLAPDTPSPGWFTPPAFQAPGTPATIDTSLPALAPATEVAPINLPLPPIPPTQPAATAPDAALDAGPGLLATVTADASNDNTIRDALQQQKGTLSGGDVSGIGNGVSQLATAVSGLGSGAGVGAIPGTLPIDTSQNAMRVVNVGTGSGGIAGAAGSAISGSGSGSGTGSGSSSSPQDNSAATPDNANPGGLFGNLFGWIGKLFGGGSSSSSDASSNSGASASGATGSGSGGGLSGALGSVGKLFANFPGGLLDSVFGKGFYQNGGLIGSLFGSGGSGAVDSSSSTFDTGAGGTSIVPDSALGTSADPFAVSPDVTSGFSGGVGDSFTGAADIPAFHTGGLIGADLPMLRSVDPAIFATAPRYHSGLDNDEFAAVLQRGERVLTANQNDRMEGMMGAVANGQGPWGTSSSSNSQHVTFNIQTPDADSFRASQPQIQSRAAAALSRTQNRNATR